MDQKNQSLPPGAFTGSTREGNPYEGDVQKAVDYDKYMLGVPIVHHPDEHAEILPNYQNHARVLVSHLTATGDLCDLGSGTGVSTFELRQGKPDAKISAFEEILGMLELARHKFSGGPLSLPVDDPELRDYWSAVQKQTASDRKRVKFVEASIEKGLPVEDESFHGGIANQALHWVKDKDWGLGEIARILKPGGDFVWNTASHKCNHPLYPSADYGFRYHDCVGYVFEYLKEQRIDLGDYRTVSKPDHTLQQLIDMGDEHGLHTENVATTMFAVRLDILLLQTLPKIVEARYREQKGDKAVEKAEIQNLKKLTHDAVSSAWKDDPAVFEDSKHIYEIIPAFRSTKE